MNKLGSSFFFPSTLFAREPGSAKARGEKGLSTFLFSKIVMLAFLVTTFAVVLSYMKLINERVQNDSAAALASQIRDSIETSLHSAALESRAVVALPKTLPEAIQGARESVETGKFRTYTLLIQKINTTGNDIISVAVGWGDLTKTSNPVFAAAASTLLPGGFVTKPANGLLVSSKNYSFFVLSKTENAICLQACATSTGGEPSDCTKC